eukprot:8250743-Ditylum_brightwellii.AAC.1
MEDLLLDHRKDQDNAGLVPKNIPMIHASCETEEEQKRLEEENRGEGEENKHSRDTFFVVGHSIFWKNN